MKGVLIRRGGFGPKATQKGEAHGGTQCASKTETGGRHLQAEHRQEPPNAERRKDSPLAPSEWAGPLAKTLIVDVELPEL